MNEILDRRNMTYNIRNYSGFETTNIKNVHYGSETIVYLNPKTWGDFVPQKIKDSENIIIFKSILNSGNQRTVHTVFV